MKKRLIALAGGAAVLAGAAVIPVGSAHGQTQSPRCQRLEAQAEATESQLFAAEENPNLTPRQRQLLITALEARLFQIGIAASAANCEFLIIIPGPP